MKKSARIAPRLSEELKERLQTRARQLDRSAAWLARHYIERGLAQDERRAKSRRRV